MRSLEQISGAKDVKQNRGVPCCRIWYILPPFVHREFRSCQGENKGIGEKEELVI
jgi:hypothetical protein